jgi:hypothetical protein
MRISIILLFCLQVFISCKNGVVNPSNVLVESSFGLPQNKGELENRNLLEASGIVASRKYPGYYWSHNDSGNPNKLYLIDSTAKGTQELEIKGAANRDWEDISLFVENNGSSTLFIGDFGDNNSVWPFCSIYWITEPDIKSLTTTSSVNSSYITFTLPDGARDIECMLIDQKTKDIYLISKRDSKKRLYRIPASKLISSARVAAEYLEELPISIPISADNSIMRAAYITSGSISPDNTERLVKSYTAIFYWRIKAGENIAQALLRPAKSIEYPVEPQGEAIGFKASGNGFVTLSESQNGVMAHLFEYLKK